MLHNVSTEAPLSSMMGFLRDIVLDEPITKMLRNILIEAVNGEIHRHNVKMFI